MAEGIPTTFLIILDGFGKAPEGPHNAISQAETPNLDRLFSEYATGEIDASESHVGLPKGFMGNSEVGHLNIGAGRIVLQDFSLISSAIEEGSFFTNEAFLNLFEKVKSIKKSTLHLVGLVSDGGVHSHISHLLSLIRFAKDQGIDRVMIHAIIDGRDTSPTSGVGFIKRLNEFCTDAGVGKIATVSGRFYAMDRDKRWERTQEAYETIVAGEGSEQFANAEKYIQDQYDKDVGDEFISPARSNDYRGVKDGDGIIFFNFRSDRARQLTEAVTQRDFEPFRRHNFPALSGFVMMTRYDNKFDLPAAYDKPKVLNSLGEVVSKLGWKQLRIAETEKYAHVTYFFNGGAEAPFAGEKRVLIPSPREVKTYDLKPEMSAREVTDRLLLEVEDQSFQFVVVNFANPDMVGHTGNLRAAIKAIETVDECIGKLVDWIESHEAVGVITADHGNCEMMQSREGEVLTSHTLQRVPIILVDPAQKKSRALNPVGRLCDIAPTILDLWGIEAPDQMTGKSLLATV